VHILIELYHIEYSLNHVQIAVKRIGIIYIKPFQHDLRRPPESRWTKKLPSLDDGIVGFMGETSLQTALTL